MKKKIRFVGRSEETGKKLSKKVTFGHKKIEVNRECLIPNTFFYRHNNETNSSTVSHPSILH